MQLFEFEGKQFWHKYGISIPESVLVNDETLHSDIFSRDWKIFVVKAQLLSGNRASKGFVKETKNITDTLVEARAMLQRSSEFPELEHILVEQSIAHQKALYVSISYSTALRSPIFLLSDSGGTGIENAEKEIQRYPIDQLIGLLPETIRKVGYQLNLNKQQLEQLIPVVLSLWECFEKEDCVLTEINPLVWTEQGTWQALDAKITLDDDAIFRHSNNTFLPRHSLGRPPNKAELAAWAIDRNDHRGVAGSTYIDLDGDIAVLASGGGASMACMDALVQYGGRPANYTEYSGNPPREKVSRLTQIALSKPNLRGCWVVGGTANFTDILETLTGFLEGLRSLQTKPSYPILIRRGGPHDTEAFAMLKKAGHEEGYDFHIYGSETPMLSTARMMVDFVNKQGNNRGNSH